MSVTSWAFGSALLLALLECIRSHATICRLLDEAQRYRAVIRRLRDDNLRFRAVIDRLRHDELTGFLVRGEFMNFARQSIRAGSVVAILDLDGLKDINDTFGHAAGDVFFREVAERIRRSGGPLQVVGRLGGDEIGVVLDSPASLRRMQAELVQPLSVEGRWVTVACGAAEAEPGLGLSELLSRADRAMYQNKRTTKRATPASATGRAA